MLSRMSLGRLAALACHLECAAPKVGNVHRGADFEDVTFYDFLISGEILGEVIDQLASVSIGRAIYEAVARTREMVGTNTNLGIVLLVFPLAKATTRCGTAWRLDRQAVREVLTGLTSEDAEWVYRAIRLAKPGGLGTVERHDVSAGSPPASLLDAMRMAASHDDIAGQYVTDFQLVFDIAESLTRRVAAGMNLIEAIVVEHVFRLSQLGDSLIARKCGKEAADHARFLAGRACESFTSGGREDFEGALSELDFWLRADGHRRNPGTTADLLAASLFVGLVKGTLRWEIRDRELRWKTSKTFIVSMSRKSN